VASNTQRKAKTTKENIGKVNVFSLKEKTNNLPVVFFSDFSFSFHVRWLLTHRKRSGMFKPDFDNHGHEFGPHWSTLCN